MRSKKSDDDMEDIERSLWWWWLRWLRWLKFVAAQEAYDRRRRSCKNDSRLIEDFLYWYNRRCQATTPVPVPHLLPTPGRSFGVGEGGAEVGEQWAVCSTLGDVGRWAQDRMRLGQGCASGLRGAEGGRAGLY
jgi:hypothetical protein